MRRILAAVRFNFLGFFRNPRTVVTFLLSAVVCFLLSGRVTEVTERYGTTMQAAEPFIWTFGDSTAILLVSLRAWFSACAIPTSVHTVCLSVTGRNNAESAQKALTDAGFQVETKILPQ